jgi:hypothetical protein
MRDARHASACSKWTATGSAAFRRLAGVRSCEFCDIIVTYGRKVRSKPVAHVIAGSGNGRTAASVFITLADDNLVGDRATQEMLRRPDGRAAVPIACADVGGRGARPRALELCRH